MLRPRRRRYAFKTDLSTQDLAPLEAAKNLWTDSVATRKTPPRGRHRAHARPAGEALQIELRRNLAAMLGATVQTKRSSESDDLSLQVSLVAGAGFEPATFGL